jgi:hypothetical protein
VRLSVRSKFIFESRRGKIRLSRRMLELLDPRMLVVLKFEMNALLEGSVKHGLLRPEE